jgi:hypothetical protein
MIGARRRFRFQLCQGQLGGHCAWRRSRGPGGDPRNNPCRSESERRDATPSPRRLHGCRSDQLPASGDLQVAYAFGRETCIDVVAVLGLDCPDTSHIVSMRAGVECPPGDRYVTFEVASYCGLIPAASMIRAALSLSRSTNRVKSGCVMLIGSPPCFTSEARTPGSDRARAMSSASV